MQRKTIRAISFVCGLALVAAGFAVSAAAQTRKAERTAHEAQVRALTDAVGHLEAMAADLALAVAADAPLPALIALRHDADLAAAALGQVSFAGEGGEALRRFAACTAEVSGVLADDLARGVTRVPDYALLTRLRDFALPLADTVLPSAVDSATGTVDDAALASHFADLGRLYYNGVGSDVQPPSGYLALERGQRLSEDEARKAAVEVAGKNARLTAVPAEGEPGRYCFTSTNLTVTITAVDGHLLSLLYDRSRREGDVGEAAALTAAEEAIAAYAPEAMTLVDTSEAEGIYYFTFAPSRDGILCLSERILVGIDAAAGRLSLWDADRYYRYHTTVRTLPETMLTPEQAAASHGVARPGTLCTALRTDGRELLCYRLGEGDAVVYVNAVTGKVETVA